MREMFYEIFNNFSLDINYRSYFYVAFNFLFLVFISVFRFRFENILRISFS